MSLALQCLVGCTLLLCGAVAVLPELVRERTPHPRAALKAAGSQHWIVQSASGHWFLDGEPMPLTRLNRELRRPDRRQQQLHYLPSGALSLAQISSSLASLRRISQAPVTLEIPELQR